MVRVGGGDDVTFRVIGHGCRAESNRGLVSFVCTDEEGEQPRRRIDTENEHSGCQRVGGSGEAALPPSE